MLAGSNPGVGSKTRNFRTSGANHQHETHAIRMCGARR